MCGTESSLPLRSATRTVETGIEDHWAISRMIIGWLARELTKQTENCAFRIRWGLLPMSSWSATAGHTHVPYNFFKKSQVNIRNLIVQYGDRIHSTLTPGLFNYVKHSAGNDYQFWIITNVGNNYCIVQDTYHLKKWELSGTRGHH